LLTICEASQQSPDLVMQFGELASCQSKRVDDVDNVVDAVYAGKLLCRLLHPSLAWLRVGCAGCAGYAGCVGSHVVTNNIGSIGTTDTTNTSDTTDTNNINITNNINNNTMIQMVSWLVQRKPTVG
jgi:hypothetical protein